MKRLAFSLLFVLPFTVHAQGLQQYIPTIITFFNATLIPFLIGISFLFITVNVIRYFVIESTNEEGRNKAKVYVIYSILAFVLISVFWGLLNLLVGATGLEGNDMPDPDFITDYGT